MTQQMTTKIAPSYDGRTNFFAFEDAVDDWRDVTELEAEKRGPALRNRLGGEASIYKRLLDRDRLRGPNDGVDYFKRTLRPDFIKGAQYKFMQFMKHNRGTTDLQKWMAPFQIIGHGLMELWMDLQPDRPLSDAAVVAYLTARSQEHEAAHAQARAAAQAANHAYGVVPWTGELLMQQCVQSTKQTTAEKKISVE